jgi:hypothetical protein
MTSEGATNNVKLTTVEDFQRVQKLYGPSEHMRLFKRVIAERDAALDLAADYSEEFYRCNRDERREAIAEEIIRRLSEGGGNRNEKE